jgi:hypothetical protein
LLSPGNHTSQITCAVYAKNSLIAMGIDDLAEFVSNTVKGLNPGNPHELPLTTRANPFQWMKQPFRRVYPLAKSPTPQAGPYLMGSGRAVFTGIIRFHPDDLAVPHMQAQRTAAAAIHIA